MDIYFVRHGETDYNKLKIIQGCGIDAPLNEKGTEQAHNLSKRLSNISFDKLISSDLIRAKQTLAPFVREGLTIEIDERIREINWGVYEGRKTTDILRQAYKEMITEWSSGNLDYAIEGGESCRSLMDRVALFIDDLKLLKLDNVLISTHGRTLRAVLILLLDKTPTDMENYNPKNCEVFHFQYDGEFVLIEN